MYSHLLYLLGAYVYVHLSPLNAACVCSRAPPPPPPQMKTLKDSNKRMKRLIQQRNSVRMSMSLSYDNFSFTKEQLNMLEERDQTIGDLQFSLDERTAQLEEVYTDI